MSHYPLIVAGAEIAGQLAPFDEKLRVPPYPVAEWSEAHVVEHIQAILTRSGQVAGRVETALTQLLHDMMQWGYVDGIRQNAPAFHEWAEMFVGLPCNDRYQFVSDRNPNAKWDHYQFGGRWAGYFRLRPGAVGLRATGDPGEPGGHAEICRFGDIDLRRMTAAALWQARRNWRDQDGIPPGLARHYRYHIAPGMTRKDYLAQQKKAVILPQAFLHAGQWHEQGRLQMSSVDQNIQVIADWIEAFNDLFYALPADTPVSIIDCHI